jgi:hypothetical protein
LALISKGYEFLASRVELEWFSHNKRPLYIWRFVMILWMTSWMWAFLVFVDNKSDFWILTFSILWLYLWFNALQSLHHWQNKIATRDFIASWLAYWLAILSKPTAFFSLWTWFGPIVIVGLVITCLWVISLMKVQSIVYYLPAMRWSLITWIGIWSTLISVLYKRTVSQISKLKYVVYWWLSLLLILILFKLPVVIFSMSKSTWEVL